MDRLLQRRQLVEKSLDTFRVALLKLSEINPEDYYYTEVRDSAIQRFEYSLDTFWRFAREYIVKKFGLEVAASPKMVLKKMRDLEEISKEELDIFLGMVDDRNITSHAYNVELAEKISYNLPDYYQTIEAVYGRCTNWA